DITSNKAPTVRDIAEFSDPAAYVAGAQGTAIGAVEPIVENSWASGFDASLPALLSPIDLQAVKASGVTFVTSLLERVIEEQAKGDKAKADALRADVLRHTGADLSQIVPGSPAAMQVKQTLVARGVWSQYLEVGI